MRGPRELDATLHQDEGGRIDGRHARRHSELDATAISVDYDNFPERDEGESKWRRRESVCPSRRILE
jgi:hypothetical protein